MPQWRFADRNPGQKPGPATRLVFDLDPGEGVTMTRLADVARAVRELVTDIGLTTYPVTSGSKGLHLYVPLDRPISSQGAVTLAKRVAQQLEHAAPEMVTSTMTKKLRAGKVFVDWSQNSASKTTIAPYSLRGRDEPTVAAPRTWEELDDPGLRQLRFNEVLARVETDGDLLAGLDPDPGTDRLSTYRSMRDASKTPEPVPPDKPGAAGNDPNGNRFVIQEHHARRLHYDLRLERDGVLVSWAVPKNLPETSAVNHLAVHTEDHPLDYLTFEATIPKGQYGAGQMVIWDTGTYDAEKFHDDEVIVNLHGSRISGRYALIQTNGDQWLAHRMKEQPEPAKSLSSGQSQTSRRCSRRPDRWPSSRPRDGRSRVSGMGTGYSWWPNTASMCLRSRSGRDVTNEYPQLQRVADALADHHVVLDGEVVALDEHGVPSFHQMQNRARATRVEYWVFDVLQLDGRSLLRAAYRDRRRVLETLAGDRDELIVPPLLPGDGAEALESSRERDWEGVVAKRLDSTYQPGRRSKAWIKDKNWNTQEIVIGGWREGTGGRTSAIGALLMGIPGDEDWITSDGSVPVSPNVSWPAEKAYGTPQDGRITFQHKLPTQDAKGVTFIEPMVGEVRYGEWTGEGRLRHPSWRGLRPDKTPRTGQRRDDVMRASVGFVRDT